VIKIQPRSIPQLQTLIRKRNGGRLHFRCRPDRRSIGSKPSADRRPSKQIVAHHNRGLLIIAIFKWCKAFVLCALALGLLKLLHRDVSEVAENFIRSLRVDPDNKFLGWALAKLSLINDSKLQALSALSFGYSALFMVEGSGLYLEKRWAEHLTIIATASFLPLEIYELLQKVDAMKISLLVINLGIILFLVITVRKNPSSRRRSA
jgi:uncharacterized membrane protein (DUF2068 family)